MQTLVSTRSEIYDREHHYSSVFWLSRPRKYVVPIVYIILHHTSGLQFNILRITLIFTLRLFRLIRHIQSCPEDRAGEVFISLWIYRSRCARNCYNRCGMEDLADTTITRMDSIYTIPVTIAVYNFPRTLMERLYFMRLVFLCRHNLAFLTNRITSVVVIIYCLSCTKPSENTTSNCTIYYLKPEESHREYSRRKYKCSSMWRRIE